MIFYQFYGKLDACYLSWQVTAGFENMFMAHNTWFCYATMMRIFKHYHLNVKDPATAANNLSFSSYAGSSL